MYFLKRSVLRAGTVPRLGGESEQNWRIKFSRWENFMFSENISEFNLFSNLHLIKKYLQEPAELGDFFPGKWLGV